MKTNKKKLIVIICIAVLAAGIGAGVYLLVNSKNLEKANDGSNTTSDTTPVTEVAPEEAESMYSGLVSDCSGALVWDLKEGDSVTIDNLGSTDACKNDNYYSKMIGYSYDDKGGVTVYVNVLKKEDNKLYKIDGTYVADYSEDTLSASLEKGTTYIYTYVKSGDIFKVASVQLMDTSSLPGND